MTQEKELFKQVWWDKNLNLKYSINDMVNWVGTTDVESKRFVRSYVESKRYKSIADFGCGPATEYFGYKNDGYEINYMGIDSSKVLHDFLIQQGVPALHNPVEKVTLDTSSYEVAFSRHVLEHLPTFRDCMSELIRVGSKEVINVFFKKPVDGVEIIDFSSEESLYHNKYSTKDIVDFCTTNPKVQSIHWHDLNEQEIVLFLQLKSE